MFSNWRWLSTAAILIVLVGGLVWWTSRPARVLVLAQTVQPQSLDAYVDERALTRLPERHAVTMPYDARLAQLAVEEGDQVAAGQLLARLVPRDLELELATAQAVVDRLQASLRENEDVALETTATRQAEVMIASVKATAEAALHQKESAAAWQAYYRANAERMLALAQTSAESQNALDMAVANEAASVAELQRQEKNARSQDLMYQAMQLLPQLIRDYLARKELQGDVIRRQLAEAETQLHLAQLRAERAVLVSPVDGVVLSRAVFSEQFLRSGSEVVTVGDLRQLEIEAEVLTQDAAHIEVGDRVEIYGQALGRGAGQGWAGRVRRVLPDAFTKVSSLGVEEQRTHVIVDLDDPEAADAGPVRLGVGYRVRVRIFTDTRDQALAVARSALFRNDVGGWSLFVVHNGRAQRREVGVGIMNDEWAEVTQGLAAGEVVIVAPESTLDEGTRVTVRELVIQDNGGPE